MLIKILRLIVTAINSILFRVEYINEEKLPFKGPAVIVSNHQHFFDVFLIHAKVKPWIYWVAKKELTEKPIIGRIVLKMGVIPVDRMKSDLSAARSMYDTIRKDRIIGIFPQGTRMKNKDMISHVIPKTGAVHFALRTGTPIIPIGIKGDYRLFRKMQVIAGDPLDPQMLKEAFKGNNSLVRQSIFVMKKVYELTGMHYDLSEDAS